MKIFITGATGFLGYHIANACIAKGHQVLCLRRTTSVSLFNDNVEHDVLWVNSDEKFEAIRQKLIHILYIIRCCLIGNINLCW